MGLFSKEPETVRSETRPPDWMAGHMTGALSRAQALSNQPMDFYPGQTYADASPALMEGLGMQENAARMAGAYAQPGLDMFTNTLGGQYLDPNYLASVAQPGIDRVMGAVGARSNLAGGRGSSLAAEAAARGATSEVMNAYNAERGRQMQALGMMPMIAAGAAAPGAELARVGGARMALDQRQIDDEMARYQYVQQEPWERLQRYTNMIQGIAPGAGQVSIGQQPADNSGFGRLLGMSMGGFLGGPAGGQFGNWLGGMF